MEENIFLNAYITLIRKQVFPQFRRAVNVEIANKAICAKKFAIF